MIAITIGIGAHKAMAERSASVLNDRCGIQTYIADERDLKKHKVKLPHFLKFYLFDMVNEENIMYFDSDVVTMHAYNPRLYCGKNEITAVRDVPNGFASLEGGFLGFSTHNYFNSGWFIVNRKHHSRAFNLCKKSGDHLFSLWYSGNRYRKSARDPNDVILYDQAILNSTISKLKIPVNFLDWRYNFMLYDPAEIGGQVGNIFSVHLIQERKIFYNLLLETPLNQQYKYMVAEDGFQKYSGRWSCYEMGIWKFEFILRQDGTVANKDGFDYWFINTRGHLVIFQLSRFKVQLSQDAEANWISEDKLIAFKKVCLE